jgi:RNA polymerase sigma-70 factor (ECF subfamily)
MTSLDRVKAGCGNEPIDGQPTPDDDVLRTERVAMVHAALAELSAEYRQILVLREIEGCRYEEIAEILELPVGTVRSRLFRARLQLRDQLTPMMREEQIADSH